MDPDATIIEPTVEWADEDYDAIDAQELEGEALGVAQCRATYDIEELEDGFCCQSVQMILADRDITRNYFYLTSATKTYVQEEGITLLSQTDEDMDFTWGAEVFASARAVGASVATMAATAIVFAQ